METINYAAVIQGDDIVLINNSTGDHEYMVRSIDTHNQLLSVDAISRPERTRVKFTSITNNVLEIIREIRPEELL